MRVLIAPDKFAGTLTAVQAAEAIAVGWRRHAPDDELDLAPMADGGPGFVDVLHAALGGSLDAVTVSRSARHAGAGASVLRVGETAYVESAQAAGLHLSRRRPGDRHQPRRRPARPRRGRRRCAAPSSSASAGSGTTDGGAGALAALGATSDGVLDGGAAGLAGRSPGRPRPRPRPARPA